MYTLHLVISNNGRSIQIDQRISELQVMQSVLNPREVLKEKLYEMVEDILNERFKTEKRNGDAPL